MSDATTSTELPERFLAFYQALNESTEPLDHMDEMYTKDVLFISPIQVRLGIDVFKKAFRAAFEDYAMCKFSNFTVMGNDDAFALFYTMTIALDIGAPMPTPVSTLFFAKEGKVYKQVDYWDTVGGLAGINQDVKKIYFDVVAKYLGGGPLYACDPGLSPGWEMDGCFHPKSEAELQTLVRETQRLGGKLRIAGSGHSVWGAIAPLGLDGEVDAPERLIILDNYREILSYDPCDDGTGDVLVTVQAGCYLGESPRHPVNMPITPNPPEYPAPNVTPTGGDFEESLLYALQEKKLALQDLGGVTHQSVGGFLSTGSAGGTTTYSLSESIVALRVIDGNGDAHDLTPDGPNAAWFAAAGVSMGLCGVLSTVTFRCIPTYNITGGETTAPAASHPEVDFYSSGTGHPKLAAFLQDTQYTRMIWWPQRNFDRLTVWQADRLQAAAGFDPKPYEELGAGSTIKQLAASMMYTVFGNLDDPQTLAEHTNRLLANPNAKAATDLIAGTLPALDHPAIPEEHKGILSEIAGFAKSLVDPVPGQTLAAGWLAELVGHYAAQWLAGKLNGDDWAKIAAVLRGVVPYVIGFLLGLFVSDTDEKHPRQEFQDYWYNGLPMDNGMDDILMPTWFTELWIPFTQEGGEVAKTVEVLRTMFAADGTATGCYAATGAFCVELYASGKGGTRFDLDAAYGDKDVFRVDVFWFGLNAANPLDAFYPTFWDALTEAGIEYRLHWGKFLPNPDPANPTLISKNYPAWDNFKAVRASADPSNIFLTKYWKDHLGL